MNNESGKKITNDPEPELVSGPNQSRRSFTKASLLAPVILSLANRPAWGANNRCVVSGFSSVMEFGSGVLGNSNTCGYASAADILSALPVNSSDPDDPDDIRNQPISTIFGFIPSYNPTIGDALRGYADQRSKYYVMAYYNSYLYEKNAFGLRSVTEIFYSIESKGSYFVSGNIELNDYDTTHFLSTIMP